MLTGWFVSRDMCLFGQVGAASEAQAEEVRFRAARKAANASASSGEP